MGALLQLLHLLHCCPNTTPLLHNNEQIQISAITLIRSVFGDSDGRVFGWGNVVEGIILLVTQCLLEQLSVH